MIFLSFFGPPIGVYPGLVLSTDWINLGLEGKLRGLPNANPQWHLGVESQNGLQIGAT